MTTEELIKSFPTTGALLDGHFLLTSGRHSDKYFEKFALLSEPDVVKKMCASMADYFKNENVDIVVGAATGGIILAYEVGKNLDTRGIFSERVEEQMTLRRGFSLEKGQRVLLVDDVVTTGGSIFELIELVKSMGAVIVGIAVMFDRTGGEIDFGFPTCSLYSEVIESWEPIDCPQCKQGTPLTQRGRTGK